MGFFSKHKALAIVALIVIAFIVYLVMFSEGEEDALTSEEISRRTAAEAVEQELLVLLQDLQALRLNDDVFSSDVFLGLTDFSQELEPQLIGRPNPFAPIGQ